ncbi:MAG: hypothetical protein E7773_06275 [Sphingomonas sp.]|uniref:DUF6356 family protein n=1 Tax=Sphingomonas sp. TaxID=28214 RepID=UPI00121C93B4|nr:DUF6356 family protein [Sphingomonas sp.]THD36612.1 MAG: hypothetical protein E7773_06275 [Sphingomonas sp.]
MIDRLFLRHPRSVGETYAQHAGVAFGFGARMIVGGVAAMVHGVVPVLCTRTASNTVKALYGRMKSRQPNFAEQPPAFTEPKWQLEYEI